MHYILVDLHNILHRSRHVVRGDIYLQTGMALHITLNSIRSVWNKFNGDHVVFCSDGRSWRKDFYTPYKANRAKIRKKKNDDEQEEDRIFYDMIDQFEKYITKRTNATFLKNGDLEADDLIAGFIQNFNQTDEQRSSNKFTIVSTDTDFQQLIDHNVQLYDGVQKKLSTMQGFFDDKGEPFNKNKPELKPDPTFMLFEKCIRGDKSDNIESAYPGCRKKGTKNKIGMIEAFEDRHNQGYTWNNFMMTSWVDFEGEERIVKDCYERNQTLIDLTQQPKEVRLKIDETIADAIHEKNQVSNVGIYFLKFCGKYELIRLSEYPDDFVKILNSKIG